MFTTVYFPDLTINALHVLVPAVFRAVLLPRHILLKLFLTQSSIKPRKTTFLYFLFLIQVFLAECAGPLIIYLMFYFRLPFIYSPKYDFTTSKHWVVQWVSACLCFRGSVMMLRRCITQSQALHSLRRQTILKCIVMVTLSRCINCINHS